MDELDVEFLLLGHALHVHEARRVGSRYIFRTCGDMAAYLLKPHPCRHSLLLDGKHSTESTALVWSFGFYNLYALDESQQVDNLVVSGDITFRRSRQAQLPHSVTGIVDAGLMGELSR